PNMTVLALEGSFASVLGGAPAAAVVFSGEVRNRTATDSRVADVQARAAETSGAARAALNAALTEVQASVRAEKLSEVAAEFDRIHSIQRAVEVGSVDAIISVPQLRARIIEAIEHGPRRWPRRQRGNRASARARLAARFPRPAHGDQHQSGVDD